MKCHIMWHFIRVCTVCKDQIDLRREKYNTFFKIIIFDPLIHLMDHRDLTVSNFMGNSTGTKKFKYGINLLALHAMLFCHNYAVFIFPKVWNMNSIKISSSMDLDGQNVCDKSPLA